jgi:hypothetical protein
VSHRDVIRAYERERKAQYRANKVLGIESSKGNVPMLPTKHLDDIRGPKHGLKIAVIPDPQCMPGVDMRHLYLAGKYIAEKRPDVVVALGDWGDFPSLSQFGRKREFENRRYRKDLAAFHQGMELFMAPIARAAGYNPWMEFIDGNHEGHIERYVDDNPTVEGIVSRADLKLDTYGWREHAFMQPVAIAGVAFCHFFPSGVMGRPITTAAEILRKLHMSAFAGHQQGRDIAFGRRADGGHMTAIISGSFYQHSYRYLSPFTNAHWRGMWMLHEVKDGAFDEMALSINFLKRKFR